MAGFRASGDVVEVGQPREEEGADPGWRQWSCLEGFGECRTDLTHEEPEVASAGVDEYPRSNGGRCSRIPPVVLVRGSSRASLALQSARTRFPRFRRRFAYTMACRSFALPATTTTVLRDVAAELGDVRCCGTPCATISLSRHRPRSPISPVEGFLQRPKRRRVPLRSVNRRSRRGPPPARPCTQGAAASLHLGDLRIRVRILPLLARHLLLALAVDARVGVSTPDASARPRRNVSYVDAPSMFASSVVASTHRLARQHDSARRPSTHENTLR